ncbi:MAG: glycoside hydrolase family 2 TIM barrel-domain containing protein [Eubacteriales bacterium]|nr:glycoside hydrolase family 2 TIM barrel-domain containing protein [Eubacteriales bacterium]
MKYQLNTTNYCDFNTYEVNKCEPRTYFVPYPDRQAADAVTAKEKRYRSPKAICLNGDWDFAFYAKPAELPTAFDTEAVQWDTLDVPSCWQFRGYDKPFYVNIRYQFPYDPPKIPTTEKAGKNFMWLGGEVGMGPRTIEPEELYNFVGVYRRDMQIRDLDKDYVMSFFGVATCLDLYINGRFVGYSEGSHNMAEFRISPYLQEGENEILAVVHRWCNGTYLESQDMFRNNGIFRDVMVYAYEPTDIWDIDFQTKKTAAGYRAEMTAVLTGSADVTFALEGHGLELTKTVHPESFRIVDGEKRYTAKVVFDQLDVKEWNAEDPVLYNAYYEIEGTTSIKERVGFKNIRIEGRTYKWNDAKIKFHGVNHHDTSCTNGYTMTPDEIERDIQICKEFNIDTIRTSHYPPDPLLLELADEYGIYIVDETDLETHGVFVQKLPPSYNWITDDPAWIDHIVDRAARMYQRDKMHVSIALWSLGNEAGAGCCTDAEYAYLKQHTDIPIHYESAVHSRIKAYDVGSEMYPKQANVHLVGLGKSKTAKFNDRPYFLCEYAHAMGVGPGNIESYWKDIYLFDALMGGCIWEMVDHAVLHEDGSYTYGGDHGEYIHDSNFCVDGIFYPDRSPSTGAWIAKHCYRPIRIRKVDNGTIELFNTRSFSAGSRYEVRYTLPDGSEHTLIPTAGPLSKEKVSVDLGGADHIVFHTIDTATGKEVGLDDLQLKRGISHRAIEMRGTAEHILGAGETEGFRIFDGRPIIDLPGNGPAGNAAVTAAEPYTILYRAATDNDRSITGQNTMEKYTKQQEKLLSVHQSEKSVTILSEMTIGHMVFACKDIYEACSEGVLVTCEIRGKKVGKNDILPRFGKTFRLPAAFSHVEYEGRIGESYIDMKEQFPIGKVNCEVSDMTEPNIRPQESGNRCDCRYASVSDGMHKVTFTAVNRAFELGIKPYSDPELLTMRHREDEKTTGTYVTIQGLQMGIGTGSCGPATAKEHTYPAKRGCRFSFLISWE